MVAHYFFGFPDKLFFGKVVFTKTAKYSTLLTDISKKEKDIWKILRGFWRVKVLLSDVVTSFQKKNNYAMQFNPNIAKNSVFFTFRLGYLEKSDVMEQFRGRIRIQRTKNLRKSIVWSQGLKNVGLCDHIFISGRFIWNWWWKSSGLCSNNLLRSRKRFPFFIVDFRFFYSRHDTTWFVQWIHKYQSINTWTSLCMWNSSRISAGRSCPKKWQGYPWRFCQDFSSISPIKLLEVDDWFLFYRKIHIHMSNVTSSLEIQFGIECQILRKFFVWTILRTISAKFKWKKSYETFTFIIYVIWKYKFFHGIAEVARTILPILSKVSHIINVVLQALR